MRMGLMTTNLQKLPLGDSDFSKLRNRGAVYVDKTALIYKLVTENSDKIFFSRPRRFGKSLLISTLESLFKYGLRDFKGLAIEKLWKERTYSVVRLDFSQVCTFESHAEFSDLFWTYIASEFSQLADNNLIGSNNQSTALNISNLLRDLQEQSLVILIDEYDSPLTECSDDSSLFERIRKEMDVFFRMLKLRDRCLRLLFITGITKYRHTGLYSGFNNFKDCSMLPAYGTLLGYTEEELLANFKPSLQFASEATQASLDDLIERLKLFYDGYSFDCLASTHVFCPWSVLKFLDEPALGFRNYWYTSAGRPTVITKRLAKLNFDFPIRFDTLITATENDLEPTDKLTELQIHAVLFQAGYLTIKGLDSAGRFLLGYPNREVKASMAQLSASLLTRNENFDACDVLEAMKTGNVNEVIAFFNKVVNAFDYHHFIIKDEETCRSCFQMLMYALSLRPEIEVHSALGRSDLEVNAGCYRWVFEYKYARKGVDPQSLLDIAARQMIDRQYGLTPHQQKILRVAAVFSEPDRKIVCWRQID